MAAFLALIRKDLLLFLSDRRAFLISFVVPIVIAAFFGSIMGGSSKPGKINVVLVQQDAGEAGRKIAAGLLADANLQVTTMTLAQAQQAVRKGAQSVAIVLPPGFGEAAGAALFGGREKPAIRLLYDPSQPAVLAMVKGMLTQQVMSVVSAEMGRPRRGLAMPFDTHEEQLSANSAAKGYNGYAHSFSGMGVQFILFMAIDMGIGILLSRRQGVWNRLLAAPVSLPLVLLARATSAALIAFGLLCGIFVVAVLAFGVNVSSVAGFLGIALSFGMLTAGFGLLIAAFGKTPEAARGIAVFATLIMVMLSGAWVPSFVFPAWVRQLTLAVPTRWAVDGLDAVTWRGLDLAAVLPAVGVQAAFAIAFMAIAIWKFKRA